VGDAVLALEEGQQRNMTRIRRVTKFSQKSRGSVPRPCFFARAIALIRDLLFRGRDYATLIILDLFCVGLSSFAIVVMWQARLRL
jgi:hypothetical protein